MSKFVKLAGITVVTAILLTGCGTPTVEDLVKNDSLYEKTLKKCSSAKTQKEATTEECLNVSKAMAKRLMNGLPEIDF